jgi:hypothetical protein
MFENSKLTSIKSYSLKDPTKHQKFIPNFFSLSLKLKYHFFKLKIDFSSVTRFLVKKITQNKIWTLGLKIIKPPPLNPSHLRFFNNTNKHSQTSLT